MVVEAADRRAEFVSAAAERIVAGSHAPRVRKEQRRMSFTRLVDLEGDLISRTGVGERSGEQPSGRLD